MIRPRRPLARDIVVIDYSYDSSEEWEEESPGDADDVVDGDDDDDDEPDAGDDSDGDSWLVEDNEDGDDGDDDDDDVEAVAPMDQVDPAPHPKRYLEGTSGVGTPYKKRKVVRLVPFVRGPVWDPAITKTVEVFAPFRVRFFNGMCSVVQPQA